MTTLSRRVRESAGRDITTEIKGLLTPHIVSRHASIIDPAHVGKLKRAI